MGDDSIESIKSEIVAAIAEGRSARDTIASNVESAKQGIERTTNLFEKAKDNIVWILGLPTAIGGTFGFGVSGTTKKMKCEICGKQKITKG